MRTVALLITALAGAALTAVPAHAETVMFQVNGAALRGGELLVDGTVTCETSPPSARIAFDAEQPASGVRSSGGIDYRCDGAQRGWSVSLSADHGAWKPGEPVHISGGLRAEKSFSVVDQVVIPS